MKRSAHGFTLIEVLIATAILGTLSILTSRSIQQAITSRSKIQSSLDHFSYIRDVVNIMEKDIQLAFHYQDIHKQLEDEAKKQNNSSKSTNQKNTDKRQPPASSSPPLQQVDPEKARAEEERAKRTATHFLGAENSLHFVTLNYTRTQRDSPEADYTEVGYFIDKCKSRRFPSKSSDCLFRRTSLVVDEDVEKGGTKMMLIENVTEFGLRYFGEGKQDWVKDWKSNESGDDTTKGHFPEIVEISMTIADGFGEKAKKFSIQILVPIRFTNNPPKEDGSS